MTHDELLAKINYDIEGNPYDEYISALRAVVELHSPCTGERHDGDNLELTNEPCVCIHCPDDLWPCATIQSIQKELV